MKAIIAAALLAGAGGVLGTFEANALIAANGIEMQGSSLQGKDARATAASQLDVNELIVRDVTLSK
jgi:hypothetical protein